MGSPSLRQFLQSLCCNSPWDYAVFWKFQEHQNEMLLVWDEGLFDFSRPMDPMEGMMSSFSLNSSYERLTSACASGTQNGSLSDCPIAVAMAEMSNTYYVVGKGLVGEAAYTECPSWIFVDNFMAGGLSSNVVSEYPEELLHQFVAGVKTMLLVPLIPHGVLQLGSLDVVQEDAGLVVRVKNKFCGQQLAACFSPFRAVRISPVQPTDLMSSYMENLGESCMGIFEIDEDHKVLGNFGMEGQHMTATNQLMSMFQDSHQIFSEDMAKIIGKETKSKINMDSVNLIDVAEPFNHEIWENSELELVKNLFGSSCLDEELACLSNFSGYSTSNLGNPVDKIMQSYSNNGIVESSFGVNDCQNESYGSGSQNLKFPSDCELHKALGQILLNHRDLNLSDDSAAASSIFKEDIINIDAPSACKYGTSYLNKTEHLMHAVIPKTNSISGDNSSNRESCSGESIMSSFMRLGSRQVEQGALTEDNQVKLSCVTSAFSRDKNSALKVSSSASSFGCMINALLEERPKKNGNVPIRSTKGSKFTDANKQRARSGENQKPRPRDRQLIQDRIKELRELVPNGTKCSIDGLLDRTIKHMQFLAHVTDQADKIGKHVVKKAWNQKDIKLPKVESNTQDGASWALEFENEQQTCPIIVKDLECPGHMLIEMLCNDHGRFLEIADVIHRLELTILKGAMEKRPDESAWAHFIVEASESFHRLDIFWPLMQLLQQNRTQISSKI
ncbi:transcription factor LHW-like isoform X1 [Coffea arabica]|uniref:Transcription factor LHW-like isoform X1 n=1 Tax=Coffea arabica TaxID=13443 RepID=A0A6P6SM15_COFAR